MEIKKLILGLSAGIILSGCVQSTAMIGPAITIASTGNVSQAGLTFITNKAVEEETGMTNQDGINTCPGNGTIVLPIKGGKEIPYPFVAPEE